ncbi:hypothetical protein Spiro2_001613 [Spirobacillus cienkowskii]|jgi:hypothetical protein
MYKIMNLSNVTVSNILERNVLLNKIAKIISKIHFSQKN